MQCCRSHCRAKREDLRNYYTGLRTGESDVPKWKFVDFQRRQVLYAKLGLVAGSNIRRLTTRNAKSTCLVRFIGCCSISRSRRRSAQSVFCSRGGKFFSYRKISTRIWFRVLRHLRLRQVTPPMPLRPSAGCSQEFGMDCATEGSHIYQEAVPRLLVLRTQLETRSRKRFREPH